MNVLNILTNLFDMGHGSLSSLDTVVRTSFLVGSYEIRIVNAWEGLHFGHFFEKKGFKSWLKHGGSIHSIGKVHRTNIPSANDEIVRMDHGKHIMQWNVDSFARLCIKPKL